MKVKSSLIYWNFFSWVALYKSKHAFWILIIFWRKKNNWNILWENHSFSIVVGSLGWFLLKVKSSLIHRNFFQGCFAQKYVVYTSFWFYFIFFCNLFFGNFLRENHPFSIAIIFGKVWTLHSSTIDNWNWKKNPR